jgi:RimJ/RimL family protein N-acetyltransferase
MRIAETPRLVLRRFRIDDAAAFYALNVDPEVIRYTGDPPFASVDAARDFVERYLGDVVVPNDDLSRWAVVERGGDEMIGFCGLRRQPSGEVDLGFRLLRRQDRKHEPSLRAMASKGSSQAIVDRASPNPLAQRLILAHSGPRSARRAQLSTPGPRSWPGRDS